MHIMTPIATSEYRWVWPGEAQFHGTLLRHYVPPNPTAFTRVSLDFRVGVGRCYDPMWRRSASQRPSEAPLRKEAWRACSTATRGAGSVWRASKGASDR